MVSRGMLLLDRQKYAALKEKRQVALFMGKALNQNK